MLEVHLAIIYSRDNVLFRYTITRRQRDFKTTVVHQWDDGPKVTTVMTGADEEESTEIEIDVKA